MINYHKTTEDEKYEICGWKYEGEYAIYNTSSYEEQLKDMRGFANPINNYYTVFDGKQLVGFFNLIDEETEVFFGIGVAPDCCNKGYGREICEEALELSRELYPGKTIYLEVRTWNARAVKCYEKAGFSIDGEPIKQTTSIGEGVFYRMVAH